MALVPKTLRLQWLRQFSTTSMPKNRKIISLSALSTISAIPVWTSMNPLTSAGGPLLQCFMAWVRTAQSVPTKTALRLLANKPPTMRRVILYMTPKKPALSPFLICVLGPTQSAVPTWSAGLILSPATIQASLKNMICCPTLNQAELSCSPAATDRKRCGIPCRWRSSSKLSIKKSNFMSLMPSVSQKK